jgi:hypothetical protein
MLIDYLRYRRLLWKLRPRRYVNLMKAVYMERSRRIVEIGVWNGVHARQMIETAANNHPRRSVEYFGFDLFEDLSASLLKEEFSKRPPSEQEVQARLEATGARIRLFKGNTRTTLAPALKEIGTPDLVFIDGGHSVASVISDWNAVRAAIGPKTTVIFDDYYVDAGPELDQLGCQTVIDSVDRSEFRVDRLEPIDSFQEEWGTRHVAMVAIRRR